MARVSDGTNVPISPAPASSNLGSPSGPLPDLEGPCFRACTMEEKINEIYLQLPLFMQNAARIEDCVQTLAQTVAAQTTKIANIEQIGGSLVARVTSLETNAAFGSSSPDSTRSWNMLGQRTGSTATGSLGSHGPGSSDDNRNTRRRLDTSSSTADEHARSAVLLRFTCEQYHKGITKWINARCEKVNMPADKKACHNSLQSRFRVSQARIRIKSQMSRFCRPDIKIMVSPTKWVVLYAKAEPI